MMRNTLFFLRRLAVLASGLGIVLLPAPSLGQGCPDGASVTTVGIDIRAADGSVPQGNPPFVVLAVRHPVYPYSFALPFGRSDISIGSYDTTVTFSVGSGNYNDSPVTGSASCPVTYYEGGCTVSCSGGATFDLYARKGHFYGKVSTYPKQTSTAVSFVYPGGSQGLPTDTAGNFGLPIPVNNWGNAIVEQNGVAGPGSVTGSFSIFPFMVGPPVEATTTSSQKTFVYLEAAAHYYEAPPCPACPKAPDNAGRPVRVTNGEMFFDHTDAVVGDLVLSRQYSSNRLSSGRYGVFGPGWNTTLDERISFPESGVIEARGPDGTPSYFVDDNADGTYESKVPPDPLTWMEAVPGGGFKKKHAAGGEEVFAVVVGVGRLTSRTDAAGVVTSYTQNASGLVTSISRLGRSLVMTYQGSRLLDVKDGTGTLLASYDYGSYGRLDGVRYPDGTGYVFGYDFPASRLIYVGDRSGRMIERHVYDAMGRATTSEIDEGREKYTFSYGPGTTVYGNGRTTVTDALGNATEYRFKGLAGTLVTTRITGPCSTCGGGAGDVQEWEYDDRANIVKKRDAEGKEWVYAYDANNRMLTETDPLNQTTAYTYDAQGRMLTRTGPDGAVTTYVQSDPGPTSITQSVTATTDRTTTIAYHGPTGRPLTITDPRGKVTTMAYSATTGELTSVTDPLSHTTTFGYDALGRRTTVTDALGHTTTTEYDIRGRVKKVTNHDGTHTDFTYDQSGRRETVKDPLGRVTRYIYDDYGRLSTVLDPLNQATRYSYDLMGNLLTLTDAKNQTTTFEYDGHYRVTKTIYPGGAYETFTYDTRGRLTTMVDRKGTTTTYAYDDLGRLTGKTFSDGTPAFAYTYDIATGRMLTAQNGTDTLTWGYNLAGELLSEQSAKNASTVAYGYDDGGNRLSVSLDGTLFVSYAYDDASRLTAITRGTNVFGFAYDAANRRTSMTYPNGVDTAYTYDALNRLTNLAATHTATSTPITNFGYVYDAAGNRTQKSTLDYTEDYGYDPLYRLTRTDRTNPGATPPNQWTWNYDAVGNRTSAQKDSEATTSSYNEKNQLTGATGGGKMLWRGTLDEPGIATFSAPTINGQPARMLAGNVFEATLDLPAGANTVTIQAQDGSGNSATKDYSVNVTGAPASYTYDANGNLATKAEGADVWVYSFNAENQLVEVKKGPNVGAATTVATYGYDPIGRRVERVSSTTTRWVYDGEDIVRETAGAAATAFIHGPGIDEPLAQQDATATQYLHADGLGSITHHTSSSGTLAQTITYDAWGNVQTGLPSPYGFTAREWDAVTSLYYYRHRWYDASRGRFISEDPLGLKAGDNMYRYVGNNPGIYADPMGLVKWVVEPPTWRVVESYDELTIACGGKGGYSAAGCMMPKKGSGIFCECVSDGCGGYRPSVTVVSKYTIIILSHKNAPPLEQTRREEQKHVAAQEAWIEALRPVAEAQEAKRFNWKITCQASCAIFNWTNYRANAQAHDRVDSSHPDGAGARQR